MNDGFQLPLVKNLRDVRVIARGLLLNQVGNENALSVCIQGPGTGKTKMAETLLSTLKGSRFMLDELKSEFPITLVENLSQAVYIKVDLLEIEPGFESFSDALIYLVYESISSSLSALGMKMPQKECMHSSLVSSDLAYKMKFIHGFRSLEDVVLFFFSKFENLMLFLHFDSLDLLSDPFPTFVFPDLCNGNIDEYEARRFRAFWLHVSRLLQNRSTFVLCTTRSTAMLRIAHGICGLDVPSVIRWHCLKFFSLSDIKSLLSTVNERDGFLSCSREIFEYICEEILAYTGGVPRLVEFTLNAMSGRGFNASCGEDVKEFFISLYEDLRGHPEVFLPGFVRSMSSRPKVRSSIFSLLGFAALRCPLQLKDKVWPDGAKGAGIPIMNLVESRNFYIERLAHKDSDLNSSRANSYILSDPHFVVVSPRLHMMNFRENFGSDMKMDPLMTFFEWLHTNFTYQTSDTYSQSVTQCQMWLYHVINSLSRPQGADTFAMQLRNAIFQGLDVKSFSWDSFTYHTAHSLWSTSGKMLLTKKSTINPTLGQMLQHIFEQVRGSPSTPSAILVPLSTCPLFVLKFGGGCYHIHMTCPSSKAASVIRNVFGFISELLKIALTSFQTPECVVFSMSRGRNAPLSRFMVGRATLLEPGDLFFNEAKETLIYRRERDGEFERCWLGGREHSLKRLARKHNSDGTSLIHIDGDLFSLNDIPEWTYPQDNYVNQSMMDDSGVFYETLFNIPSKVRLLLLSDDLLKTGGNLGVLEVNGEGPSSVLQNITNHFFKGLKVDVRKNELRSCYHVNKCNSPPLVNMDWGGIHDLEMPSDSISGRRIWVGKTGGWKFPIDRDLCSNFYDGDESKIVRMQEIHPTVEDSPKIRNVLSSFSLPVSSTRDTNPDTDVRSKHLLSVGISSSDRRRKAGRSGRGRYRKRDPDAPRGPLSAYLYFCKDEREVIKKENPNATFLEQGRIFGLRWRNLNEERMEKYTRLSETDKRRYQKEIAAYNQKKKLVIKEEVG